MVADSPNTEFVPGRLEMGSFARPSMEESGLAALTDRLKQACVYLEYGMGGSTLLAARCGVKHIISVDTDRKWIESVRREATNFTGETYLCHCDLGPVREWGLPMNRSRMQSFHSYAQMPWDIANEKHLVPQLVLIDGRFRVACFLYSLLQGRVETPILFDDYRDRSYYHIVEEFCDVQQMHGRMAEFAVTKNYSHKRLTAAIMKYSVDPE